MQVFGRYRLHAQALLTISRKFEELSTVDRDNADLLAQCAASLSEMAEALVVDAEDAAAIRLQLH